MKIALVTGGSRGLGKSMSLHIAAKGSDVVLTYKSKRAEAEEVVKQIEQSGRKAAALALDVSDSKSFDGFAERLKQVLRAKWERDDFNFLVNNAGIGIYAPFAETSEKQFDELMNVQLKGPNISTGLARFALPGYAAYATMKGGIEVLTRYMAKELGARRISVTVVAPGAIETDFAGGAVRDNKEVNKFLASQTALGRVGLPDDIGSVVASLLGDDNHWITAQRIEASGGMFL